LLYTDRYVICLCIQDKEREPVVYISVIGSREPRIWIYQQFSRFFYKPSTSGTDGYKSILIMDRSFPIQQLKESNEKVFEQIVKSYWSRIHSFANIYVIDREVAKEIVQDTFLALWDQRENLDDKTCLITYLMVVSRNKCLNYLKSLQLDTISIHDLSEFAIYQRSNIYTLEDDSFDILVTKELADAITVSLNKLPPRTREIFMLSRYSCLKHKEISDQLGVTVKDVEYHIGKALKHLKSDLSNDYFIIVLCLLQFILMKK
jgi:RNA polymerase sigma-70 factor, ECF subfamily